MFALVTYSVDIIRKKLTSACLLCYFTVFCFILSALPGFEFLEGKGQFFLRGRASGQVLANEHLCVWDGGGNYILQLCVKYTPLLSKKY